MINKWYFLNEDAPIDTFSKNWNWIFKKRYLWFWIIENRLPYHSSFWEFFKILRRAVLSSRGRGFLQSEFINLETMSKFEVYFKTTKTKLNNLFGCSCSAAIDDF